MEEMTFLNQNDAETALKAALKSGGDFAEIYLEDTRSTTIEAQKGVIEQAVSGRDHGAGIRILKGTRSVYAYTNDTSLQGLVRAAEQAAAALGDLGEGVSVTLTPSGIITAHFIAIPPSAVDYRRKTAAIKDISAAALGHSPLISQVRGVLSEKEKSVRIANSDGLFIWDERTYVRIMVSAVASKDGENQTGSQSPGAFMGFEFIEGLDLADLGKRAAATAVTMLEAPVCPAGVMPVVIDNGFGGVLFHEACGHSLEATSVAKGTSQFAGKLGRQIASKIVSAVDDGTMANEWGSIVIDDEGAPSRRNVLIKDGILTGYLVDKLNGRRMNAEATGSSRRQDYTFAPTSRMTNTFICPGNDDDAEMIATMGDGLYAKQMGGGSVNPATGEFNFAVMEGYLVKGGSIAHPVRGATLIGKGDEVLAKIDRVGKNMTMAQGMCGSLSGSVPTNVGQPMIRISSLTVGGR